MEGAGGTSGDVAVPVNLFTMLRRELAGEVGTLPTIHALHAAGYATGNEAAAAFRQMPGGDVTALPQGTFWSRFGTFLARKGWGHLAHSAPHPGVGVLRSTDWIECAHAPTSDDASCSFTAGYLSGLLSQLASAPVAVLETTCRGRGDDGCSFAFGAENVIHDLYGELLEDGDLEAVLDRL